VQIFFFSVFITNLSVFYFLFFFFLFFSVLLFLKGFCIFALLVAAVTRLLKRGIDWKIGVGVIGVEIDAD
jgi:hypothetical protein